MCWYVKLSGRIVGWVISANHDDALAASLVKYPGWGIEEDREVIQRSRKRSTPTQGAA